MSSVTSQQAVLPQSGGLHVSHQLINAFQLPETIVLHASQFGSLPICSTLKDLPRRFFLPYGLHQTFYTTAMCDQAAL